MKQYGKHKLYSNEVQNIVFVYMHRINRITWHQGAITDDEVLGGDKGGGTFKMCFQLLMHQRIHPPSQC